MKYYEISLKNIEKLNEAPEVAEPPEEPRKPTKIKTKTKPDVNYDPFQQQPDQPLTNRAEKPQDQQRPQGPTIRRASQADTQRAAAGVRLPPEAMRHLQNLGNIEIDPNLADYPSRPEEPEFLPSTRVNTENLPTVAGQALAAEGIASPAFHQVASLPGNMSRMIRQLGKLLFGSMTTTATEDIYMIGNLGGQGPNTRMDVNSVANFVREHGEDLGPGDIDFDRVMPGYTAQTHQYVAAGIRWLLVRDFAGEYIYCWPESDSTNPTNQEQLGNDPRRLGENDDDLFARLPFGHSYKRLNTATNEERYKQCRQAYPSLEVYIDAELYEKSEEFLDLHHEDQERVIFLLTEARYSLFHSDVNQAFAYLFCVSTICDDVYWEVLSRIENRAGLPLDTFAGFNREEVMNYIKKVCKENVTENDDDMFAPSHRVQKDIEDYNHPLKDVGNCDKTDYDMLINEIDYTINVLGDSPGLNEELSLVIDQLEYSLDPALVKFLDSVLAGAIAVSSDRFNRSLVQALRDGEQRHGTEPRPAVHAAVDALVRGWKDVSRTQDRRAEQILGRVNENDDDMFGPDEEYGMRARLGKRIEAAFGRIYDSTPDADDALNYLDSVGYIYNSLMDKPENNYELELIIANTPEMELRELAIELELVADQLEDNFA
jgi:hypothetical protein